MGTSGLIRFWRRRSLCALVAIALPMAAFADPTTTTASPKKPATTHPSHTSASHSTSSHSTSSHAKKSTTHSSHGKKTAKKRGQHVIDSERARQIQEALIREHYLNGEPSGTWDSSTQAAMQRYQADQGWQNKTTPDSRALIKLGLGPSKDHLLNPESAMTSAPPVATGDPTSKAAPKLPADPNLKPTTDSNSSPVPNNQPNR